MLLQAMGGKGTPGQGRSLQLRNGLHSPSEPSSSLDPVFTGGQFQHARKAVGQAAPLNQGLPAQSSRNNQAFPHNIWQQHSTGQSVSSADLYGDNAILDDLSACHQSGDVMDLLQSAQGMFLGAHKVPLMPSPAGVITANYFQVTCKSLEEVVLGKRLYDVYLQDSYRSLAGLQQST